MVAGIDVNYAAPGRQQQNVAERHIQSFDKKQNAILIAQDLLGPSFWQLAGRATAITINGTYNSLLSNATPMLVFQGRTTDVSKQFRVGFGKPVICNRIASASSPKIPGVASISNEFGVSVGPGHPSNNSVLVYLPSRGTNSLSVRFDVRKIRLGSQKQMSLEDGQAYLPVLGPDGQWHLVTRGETGILGKAFVMEYGQELGPEPQAARAEIATTTFNSSIAGDEVLEKLAEKGVFRPLEPEELPALY